MKRGETEMHAKGEKAVIRTCLVPFVTLLLVGCSRPSVCPRIADSALPGSPIRRKLAGTSVERRPLDCIMVGTGNDVTLVLAAIHGDEPAGVGLVCQLAGYLQRQPSVLAGRKVVLLPLANPDGLARNDRHNARGVDLNRNFPAENRTEDDPGGSHALSEPEARVIERVIRQYAPGRIVSIHQLTAFGPEALSAAIPGGCVDYDGPGRALAERISRYCDLPVEKIGAMPGSLGSYAGVALGIPTVTLELPLYAHQMDDQLLWQRYGRVLVAAIVYPALP
jgi:protein MpaA